MRIAEIWRFPVKSLGGERIDRARVDELGIEGDRAWGILDLATGLVLTARREPDLLFLDATLRSGRRGDGRPGITTSEGRSLDDDMALSAHLGRAVELRPANARAATFENPLDVERETDWVRWDSSGGTFHDGRSKLSLVSTGTLGVWDRRRFRLNVVLDGAGEERLSGELALGSSRVAVRKPIDRCVMVTRPQPGIDRDPGVLREIIRDRGNLLGIGCTITEPGEIAVGDELIPS